MDDEIDTDAPAAPELTKRASRERKAHSGVGWSDPGTVALAFGSVVGVFASKPLAAALTTIMLAVSAVGYGAYVKPEFRKALYAAYAS